MKVHLVDCFMEVLQVISGVCSAADKNTVSIDNIDKDIESAFLRSVHLANSLKKDIREYDNARFAVCALIDELMLTRTWQSGETWSVRLFQKKYYATVNAGVEFYHRLSKLSDEENEVREVYFVCLTMGFLGMYGEISDRALYQNIVEDTYLLIMRGSGYALSTQNLQSTVRTRTKLLPERTATWMLPVMALLAMYFLIDFMLQATENDFISVSADWVRR